MLPWILLGGMTCAAVSLCFCLFSNVYKSRNLRGLFSDEVRRRCTCQAEILELRHRLTTEITKRKGTEFELAIRDNAACVRNQRNHRKEQ
jgi:hypothetical protein